MNDQMRIKYEAKLLKCRVEMEGMIAENQQRIQNKEAIAYTKCDFDNIQNELEYLIRLMGG